MLGLGRALGETMAVTMVIGNSPTIRASLFAPGYSLPAVIANEFAEASGDLHTAALAALGLLCSPDDRGSCRRAPASCAPRAAAHQGRGMKRCTPAGVKLADDRFVRAGARRRAGALVSLLWLGDLARDRRAGLELLTAIPRAGGRDGRRGGERHRGDLGTSSGSPA